ncbi:MAG: hypothetical protein WC365_06960, partial [Candidatus Babeliales bacterium]
QDIFTEKTDTDFFVSEATKGQDDDDIVTTRSIAGTSAENDFLPSINIVAYAKKFITRHNSASLEKISEEQRKKINITLSNICTILQKNLEDNNIPAISKRTLDLIFKTALYDLVPADFSQETFYKIWDHVHASIIALFAQHKMHTGLIPDELKEEYAQAQNIIMGKLMALMTKRKKDSLTQEDIDIIVHNVFDGFIERMERILIGHLVTADLQNLHQKEEGKPLSSTLMPNPKSTELYKQLPFLHKDPVISKDLTTPALPLQVDQ